MTGGKKGGNQQQKGNQEQFKFDFGAPVLVNSQGQQQQGGAIKFDFSGAQGGLMQAVSGKLGNLIGQSSGYFESLPKPVQDRIKALRKLHDKRSDLEKEFKKELIELEKKYAALYNPLYERRKDIVTGASEPTPEELQPTKAEAEKAAEQKTEQAEQKTEQKTEQKQEDVKGVPSFWLEALKHSDEFGDFITERDEEALSHLYDIKATPFEKEGVSSQSFSLEFFFTPNAFFDNDVIKKTYFLVDKEFGTTMFDKVESTEIKWKQGKNLTVTLVTKQQGGNKRGGRGGKGRGGRGGAQQPVKTITVEEPCQSFFNFFNPTAGMEDADPEELQAILEDDYELGLMVKDEIIPNAVLWFTGEAAELYGPMYGEDFEDDDEYDDEDDDDEEEEEEEEAPRGRGGARGGRGGRGARIGEVAEDYKSDEDPDYEPDQQQQGQQPECKQQ